MKTPSLLLTLCMILPATLHAQYTGGIGRGDDMDAFQAPRLLTSFTATTEFCGGGPLLVGYNSSHTLQAGNISTVQLSDASGSFSNPVAIGSAAHTGSGQFSITANIPANTPGGNAYRLLGVRHSP